MAVFNSYSSTATKPRWRVFIPTEFAMSVGAYRAIVKEIMRRVNEAGYWSQQQLGDGRKRKSPLHHGFDMSKLVPSSLFYLPCQAKNPTDSFFADYRGDHRRPLDPYHWAIATSNRVWPAAEAEAAVSGEPVAASNPVSAMTITPAMANFAERLRAAHEASIRLDRDAERDTAIADWRTATKGDGNRAFFELGLRLKRLGLPESEIGMTLRQEAELGHSPAERRREVKPLMKKLRRLVAQRHFTVPNTVAGSVTPTMP